MSVAPVLDAAAPPPWFTRVVSVPPGAPWDQALAARLEARESAPLPLDRLHVAVKRMGAWRAGAQGRFAVLYLRAEDAAARETVRAEFEGVEVRFSFRSPRARLREAAGWGLKAVAALLLIAGPAAGWMKVSAERQSRLAALHELETAVKAKSAAAADHAASVRRGEALARAGLAGRDLPRVLDDLARLSAAKSPEATAVRVEWTPDALTIAVREEGSPLRPGDPTAEFLRTDSSRARVWAVKEASR